MEKHKYEGWEVIQAEGGRGRRKLYYRVKDPKNPNNSYLVSVKEGYQGKDGKFHAINPSELAQQMDY